jgi:FkbM family methyltransferase
MAIGGRIRRWRPKLRRQAWEQAAGPTPDTALETPAGSAVYAEAYEPAMTAAVARLTKPGSVCADVGAHFGWFTVLMADLAGPEGRVHAFEASQENIAVVTRNVQLNDQDGHVSVHHAAVTDGSSAEVPLFAGRAGGSMEWTVLREFAGRDGRPISAQVERVPAVRLDDHFAPGARLDVMKMDIEGGEVQALRGARRLLREARPIIVLEYHREVAWPAVEELVGAGYTFTSLEGRAIPTPQDTDEVPYQFVALPRA